MCDATDTCDNKPETVDMVTGEAICRECAQGGASILGGGA